MNRECDSCGEYCTDCLNKYTPLPFAYMDAILYLSKYNIPFDQWPPELQGICRLPPDFLKDCKK